ncbi:thermonuclease family protein [Nitrosopumilus sp.]|uniref:thermonuclease family protein n=1 Tax=Nitrosopumilus sp. TaxID=2024843 RepID=UPI002931D5BC|nr:thermonuclease family protein [Nitrosopumilus sp.]
MYSKRTLSTVIIVIFLGIVTGIGLNFVFDEEEHSGYDNATTAPVENYPILDCQDDSGECFSSTVSRIVDGDTIHLQSGQSIRLVLVDSPEIHTDKGTKSKEYLESICPVGSIIHVDEDDNQSGGSYGRTIAKVYCDDDTESLNQKIIKNNHGTIYQRFCEISEFGEEGWAVKYGC